LDAHSILNCFFITVPLPNRAHEIDQIPIQLPRWNLAQGKVLPDLVTRRAEEVALFNS
jgi:GH24 family phage-related lysozyme (muramidase)